MHIENCLSLFVAIFILSSFSSITVFAQSEEMTVSAQQEFDISLPSNPSTGYQWTLKDISDESIVTFRKTTFVPSGSEMPGSGGTEVLTFLAEMEGTATITLQYLRSWEPDEPAETRTILVTVVDDFMGTIPGPNVLVAESGPEGKYNVTVLWFSDDIGQENIFSIRVYDAETNEEIYDGLTLDFSISQGEQVFLSEHLTGPITPNTEETRYTYGAKYTFANEGSYLLKIANINGSGETVEFPIQVTPEFTPIAVMLMTVSALAGVIVAGMIVRRHLV